MDKKTKESQTEETNLTVRDFCVITPIFGSIGTIIYQCYFWLKDGYWTSYSMLNLIYWVPGLGDWAHYPWDWLGLHKILDSIPQSLFLFLLGSFLIVVVGFSKRNDPTPK